MDARLKKLSILLLDPLLTDQQFTEEVRFIKDFPVYSICVLPYKVRRAKQLLAGSAIQIDSLVDYPLSAGTLAKKAFETGQLYQEGAENVFVTTTFEQLKQKDAESYQVLEPLSFGHAPLGFLLDTHQLTEGQKKAIAIIISQLPIPMLSLGVELTMEEAIIDTSLFQTGRSKNMKLQVNVKEPTLMDIELLLQTNISRIGISNGHEILSLMSKEK